MDRMTQLVRSGRDLPTDNRPAAINPPVIKASTVLYSDLEMMQLVRSRRDKGERIFSYGAHGTPTTHFLEDSLCALEGGDRAFVFPTGLSALAAVFLTYTKPGDHVAVIDNAYPPVRRLCDEYFANRGVKVSYFAPNPESLSEVIRSETSLVLAESPGSGTFEIVDLPALAKIAHEHEAILAVDNTWSAGVFLQPLKLGADISVQAATKYLCGASDIMMGTIVCKEACAKHLYDVVTLLGIITSPEDCYDTLRGMRSLYPRLKQHEQTAIELAKWLNCQDAVAMVLHPSLPDHPGHEIWKRDFSGSSGLFAFGFTDEYVAKTPDFINELKLFGIGSSWGGFESLSLPVSPASIRSCGSWDGPNTLVRIHAGLESPGDLIADLQQALARISQ